MKILLISSLYPPLMLGGAEDSARNWAQWLACNGHDVAVVRTADRDEPAVTHTGEDGVRVHVVATPHVYPAFRFPKAAGWKKPIWHLQDHFTQATRAAVGAILDRERPDLVNIHLLQGLGYPILTEIAKRRLPVAFTLHDLGLACIRMSMFKNGADCEVQCAPCQISSRYKQRLIRQQSRIGFVSPSHANLDALAKFFPLDGYPTTVMLNPNAYPVPQARHQPGAALRLLYAGRIHATKGVDLLLDAVSQLVERYPISIAIAGRGQLEAELRARYEGQPWCSFLGFVTQQELADHMAQSDLLCIPSIWAENSPGVVIQALGVGLPVIGSDRGGIPELVNDGINGRLVREQTVPAWREAIGRVASGKEPLAQWRANATARADDFGQEALARNLLEWMEKLAVQPTVTA